MRGADDLSQVSVSLVDTRPGSAVMMREIEAERHALAERINDDPVQTLAHISRMLQSLEAVPGTPAETAKAVREAGLLAAKVSEQLRGLARELRPPLLDDVGLGAALKQLAEDFSQASGIATVANLARLVRRATAEADLVLFRVAQAALRYAKEHAAATSVDIRLRGTESHITLTVCNDGIELVPHLAAAGSTASFLEMEQRLGSVGGGLVVRSGPQSGTTLRATVPTAPGPERVYT